MINPALSLLTKHLVIGQRQKAPNFSAFHWSPHGSLVSICSAFRNHEGNTFTEKDRNKLNYRIGPRASNHQLCSYARPAQPGPIPDQAVRAVHSCNSWLLEYQLQFQILCFIMNNLIPNTYEYLP